MIRCLLVLMSIPNIPRSGDPIPEASIVDKIARKAPILSPTNIIHKTLLHETMTHKRVGMCGANFYRLGDDQNREEEDSEVTCDDCKFIMSIEEVMIEAIKTYLNDWCNAKDALPQTSKFLAQLSPKVLSHYIIQNISRSIVKRGD